MEYLGNFSNVFVFQTWAMRYIDCRAIDYSWFHFFKSGGYLNISGGGALKQLTDNLKYISKHVAFCRMKNYTWMLKIKWNT